MNLGDKILNILLIEDNKDDVELIKNCLIRDPSNPKVSITNVSRLEEGINQASTKPFDIVLLDLSLPDSLSGDINTFYHFHSYIESIPVIIMTGRNDPDTATKAIRAGAQDYFIKEDLSPKSQGLIRCVRYAYERGKHIEDKRDPNKEELKNKIVDSNDPLEQARVKLDQLKSRLRDE
jgi:hypothetical protein